MIPKIYCVVFLIVTSYLHTVYKSGIKLSEDMTIYLIFLTTSPLT